MSQLGATVRLTGEGITFDSNRIGRYGRDKTGQRVVVMWKVFHRVENSYSLSTALEAQIDADVEVFYIVDKDTQDVLRYEREAYRTARVVFYNGQRQYAPDRSLCTGWWDGAADDILSR